MLYKDICPCCQSEEISVENMEFDDKYYKETIACLKCNCVYEVEYDFIPNHLNILMDAFGNETDKKYKIKQGINSEKIYQMKVVK
jgi:hypothetical protein